MRVQFKFPLHGLRVTDLIDATRSARLELLIVILILAELVVAIAAFFRN